MDKKIKELIASKKLSDVQIYEYIQKGLASETPADADSESEQDSVIQEQEETADNEQAAEDKEPKPVKLEDLKKMMADLIDEKLKATKQTTPKKPEPQAKQSKLPKDYKPGEFVLLA